MLQPYKKHAHRWLVKKVPSAACSKQRPKCKSTMVEKVGEAITADLSKVKAGVKASPGGAEWKG